MDGGRAARRSAAVAMLAGAGAVGLAVAGAPGVGAESSAPVTGPGAGTWVVPDGVTCATFVARGGAGGSGGTLYRPVAPGGRGARVEGTVPVRPGEVLEVRVGGAGTDGGVVGPAVPSAIGVAATEPGAGGAGGGGDGGSDEAADAAGLLAGGGGGGASWVLRGTTPLLVAGGGGGGGSSAIVNGQPAGGAGGDAGLAGARQVAEAPGSYDMTSWNGDGGAPGSDGTGGAGGPGGVNEPGDDVYDGGQAGGPGTATSGGPGAPGRISSEGGYGVGGGGGGGFGGGGGGGAGISGFADRPFMSFLWSGSGGGGGGGGSLVPSGGTFAVDTQGGDGSVVISWTVGDTSCLPLAPAVAATVATPRFTG